MLHFIVNNWVSILTLALLALAVFFAIRKLVKDKKAGIGACGCKCADCPHSSKCHSLK